MTNQDIINLSTNLIILCVIFTWNLWKYLVDEAVCTCSQNGSGEEFDDDGLFDLLTQYQSRRIDDQRCSFRLLDNPSPEADESKDVRLGRPSQYLLGSEIVCMYTCHSQVCSKIVAYNLHVWCALACLAQFVWHDKLCVAHLMTWQVCIAMVYMSCLYIAHLLKWQVCLALAYMSGKAHLLTWQVCIAMVYMSRLYISHLLKWQITCQVKHTCWYDRYV